MKNIIILGFAGLLVIFASANPQSSSTIEVQVGLPAGSNFLRSSATGRFLVVWNDGEATDIHASALHADERAEMILGDAGNGKASLFSPNADAYWSVCDTAPDGKIRCSKKLTSECLFTWMDNGDGTISLRSDANGRFVSVVEEDTTIIPEYPKASSAKIISDEMRKPFVVKNFVLRARASVIGDSEKFMVESKPLKKSAATERLSKVLTLMYGISGKQTIGGIHNREPNSNPAQWTNWVFNQTGVYPGLWGGDFLFESDNVANRGTLINQAKAQWDNGAVVTLMYHMCPPTQGESCGWDGGIKSSLSDAQWTQLITDGASLNATFKQRLKNIGAYLKTLKDDGVEVLFRPMHEMNQGNFWWGGRTGPSGTARLYQITHDYLVDTLGLTNMFFVWSVQDLSWNFQDYNPGDAYWDIMSLDVYNGDGYTLKKYNAMLDVAGPKLIAIAETDRLPTSAELKAQPRWVYFSGWAELVQSSNSSAQIKDSYTAEITMSRNEMPGWNNVNAVAAIGKKKEADEALRSFSADFAKGTLRFHLPERSPVRISLHDSRGRLMAPVVSDIFAPGAHERKIVEGALPAGIYFLKVGMGTFISIRKIEVLNP